MLDQGVFLDPLVLAYLKKKEKEQEEEEEEEKRRKKKRGGWRKNTRELDSQGHGFME